MDKNNSEQATSSELPRIPYDQFETSPLPSRERFAVWRESILPLFEPFPAEGLRVNSFQARVESFDLTDMFFAMTSFSAQRFQRGPHHKADFGADHFLLQLYLSGGYAGRSGQQEIIVNPGDISLLDLAKPLETQAERSEVMSLIIPRDLMASWIRLEQLNSGGVLKAEMPSAKILRHHLTTVWKSLPEASLCQLASINHMVLGTVVGAFRRSAGLEEQVQATWTQVSLDAICAYIHDNLDTSDLDPEHLCRRFACSRAQLYRMFAPIGGVARYIRDSRLARCLDELTRSTGGRQQIIDVATRWGFSSHSHFCRAFRQVYGFTPSEAVERAVAGRAGQRMTSDPLDPAVNLALYRWLRQV